MLGHVVGESRLRKQGHPRSTNGVLSARLASGTAATCGSIQCPFVDTPFSNLELIDGWSFSGDGRTARSESAFDHAMIQCGGEIACRKGEVLVDNMKTAVDK